MKAAYEIAELAKDGPIGRSKIYEKIADGSLIARKCDDKTLILGEDWIAFLRSLPVAKLSGKKRSGSEPEAA